ncbi:MAG: holo-ACP synthase [Burkholderiaceae bacterium]|nr:holo-ACP synthase [Burkholderiaceae bacterium]
MMAVPVSPGVAGIGVDLLRVDRVAQVYARHGQKFVNRILGPQEIEVFQRRLARDPQRGIRFLATRFAAKEAFSKAIGLGMRSPMAWSRMQTLNQPSGKPGVQLSEPLASWYAQRFGVAHVSITDESDMVAAFVVVNALSSPNLSNAPSTS